MILDPGGTAPFNRPTAYILFGGFYSVFYLVDYLIIVPLTYAALRRCTRSGARTAAIEWR
jgi:hypothetical protein